MKISVVTACGNKKADIPLPAWQLYNSPRIRAIYNRKGSHDMFILSAEYGLIPAEKIIAPYNRIMDEKRAQELIPYLKEVIKDYDVIVYFKAGARRLYEQCLEKACQESGVKLVSFGFGFMGGINELDSKIRMAEEGKT
ncbi:DUF6884 domain-containing protein [Candidatus Nitrosotenuis cloacae]|uniref:DUF6884 domain-containing protein n=1 Tax=Candidatus Nitrosotenuis cloacae TaxID=1603555 RepID=UPI00227E9E28|nr:DUF6884 domain-containing protein [Candidatus Nitrosotenuis cloacae]